MLSVIVPVLNEAAIIGAALGSLLRQPGHYEVIVVDGGSTDDTCDLVRALPVRLIQLPPGQSAGIGSQINLGAAQARGDVLLFLHADVRLPPGAVTLINACLSDPGIVGGGFVPGFSEAAPGAQARMLKVVERFWQNRTRLFCWFAGDTAPFIRAEAFKRMGGYPPASFASDWDFAGQLRALGPLAVIPEPVIVDSRRHIQNGVLKTLLVTGSIELMYRLGAGRDFLRGWYRWWLPRERETLANASKEIKSAYEQSR